MTATASHEHLIYEATFWGDCCNTYGEESKQFVYARCMGLPRQGLSFDVQGRSVLDVGGGPVSMLLKGIHLGQACVVDPIVWPEWVQQRYAHKGICLRVLAGEDLDETGWDEAWIYNVLQHVEDPERVVANMRRAASLIRMFEWVDMRPYAGHPHMLSEAQLSQWLRAKHGQTQMFEGESGCFGKAYFGIFHT